MTSRFFAARTLLTLLAGLLAISFAPLSTASADPAPVVTDKYLGAYATKGKVRDGHPRERSDSPGVSRASQHADPFEYRLTLACGSGRVRSIQGSEDVTNCLYALSACQYRNPPSDQPLYYVWKRRTSPPKSPWVLAGETCGTQSAPPAAVPPPPVPTLGQIQDAFRRLPFSKPTVRIEPRGNVTLVNLPTYYEATWPDDTGLQPGETSQPVQLLSWSVEFRVSSRSYTFHYGDGTSSGRVSDAGGGYPSGSIRHTYAAPNETARVRVDSQLTGQFRVNGGEWIDVDTVADLQNEPVTTLVVTEAKARLYTN